MQTNDNEYFRSAVTDEWNTPRPLTGQEQAEEQKQQTFRTKRHKTAQRAFSLAAPVAVVAVAATLVTVVAGPVCPVCGKEQCNYFYNSNQMPAQILYEGDVPAAQPETSDGADRLTYLDYAFGGVESQDQCRFLEMDGQTAGISGDPISRFLYSEGLDYYSSSSNSLVDEESGTRLVFQAFLKGNVPAVYAELVYLPQGGSPGETETYGEMYLENLFEQGQDYTYAVIACEQPDLWLRAYSTFPEVPAEQILEVLGDPVVLPLPGSKVEVGSSLYMTLPASQYLWASEIEKTIYSYGYFYGEDGHATSELPVYAYSQGPRITSYVFETNDSTADFRIEFAERDWNAVADAWNELYRQAPATGHEPYAVMVPLQSMTVNGVTYDVYLDFLRRTEDGVYDGVTVRFVPRQQPTCRISVHIFNQKTTDPFSLSGKSLEEVASRDSDYMDVLSLFYPEGAEPNPLPTPEPSPTPTPEPTPTPTPEIKQQRSFNEMIPQYPFNEFNTDEDEQWRKVEFYTRLDGQLTKLGFPFSNGMGWGYYGDDYYVKGHPYEQDGKMLVYLEVLKFWDGTIPQQSDQYGVDTEMYPTYIDWSQTKSYAMRAAEGGCFIRVYSFLDELTAQEILDNITDKAVSEFR